MTSLFSSSWSVSKIPDLASRVFLVTGGTAGIGFGITANLLKHNPAKIYMLSEDKHQADLSLDELSKYGQPNRVEWVKCDLRDLKEVDKTAKGLHKRLERLDALILNAGIGVGLHGMSKDGIENHFQINLLSQISLLFTLLPNLLRTGQTTGSSRVVFQSSDLHKLAPAGTKFGSLDEINEDVGPSYLYNRSKLSQIVFMHALLKRYRGRAGFDKLFVNCTHPGGVSTTQQDQAIEAYGPLAKVAVAAVRPLLSDPITLGCAPALFAATAEEVVAEGINGAYITPPAKIQEPSNQAKSEELQNNLWDLQEKLLREKLAG